MDIDVTQKIAAVKRPLEWEQSLAKTPISPRTLTNMPTKKGSSTRSRLHQSKDVEHAYMAGEQCRQLCLSVFFREHGPVRSLGFTSAIGNEGKTFVALVFASVLAHDTGDPVTLLECNWERPCFHDYFGLPSKPGLAEWLREECDETAIRYQINHNLTVIPAGDGAHDAVRLLNQIQKKGLVNMLACANERLIVDLPAIITVGYGPLAARLVESLMMVVHTGATSASLVADTLARIADLPVEGVILNQIESRIPGWIRQIL